MTRTLPFVLALSTLTASTAMADPCGMVPPIHVNIDEPGIVRTGDQITYSFFKDGVQSVAIRPGFTGSVAEFGMLLRGSEFSGRASYGHALSLARESLGEDKHGYRNEFLGLVKKARALSGE